MINQDECEQSTLRDIQLLQLDLGTVSSAPTPNISATGRFLRTFWVLCVFGLVSDVSIALCVSDGVYRTHRWHRMNLSHEQISAMDQMKQSLFRGVYELGPKNVYAEDNHA